MNNKEIGNVIKIRNKITTLQSEITKTKIKLNNAKTQNDKMRYERQLKQLQSLLQQCYENLAYSSINVDIDPIARKGR